MVAMKDSGIEWIGEIPSNWDISKIKYVSKLDPVCNLSGLKEQSIVTYTPMEFIKQGYYVKNTSEYGKLSSTLTHYEDGDIVMAKVTPCFENGNIAIMEDLSSGIGLGSSELFVLRIVAGKIVKRYFFYWLQNPLFVGAAQSTMTGTGGLKRVSPYFVRNCPLHYPPLPEQQSIADYLDTRCNLIDSVIEKTRSSIEEYKKFKQAVITQAVTKGVRGDRPMRDSGIEWIGEIPEEWKISRVGLHFNIILGKMLCPSQPSEDYTLESYYCAANVHFDGISDTELKQMWFSGEEKSQYRVNNGDLLVVEGGAGAGGCVLVKNIESDIFIQNSIMIVRSKGYFHNVYLRYLIECLVKDGYIDIVCNKATIPHFTKEKLSNVPFPVSEEQQEIANYLDHKCSEIDNLIARKTALLTELESYKRSLIYEYVTGKKEVPH